MTIAVLGSINIDVTAYGERLPSPGETIHGTRYQMGLGGKGANQAVAIARLGTKPVFFGRVGRDTFGVMARAQLEHYGVPVQELAEDASQATGIAIISVDPAGQNTITVIAGANYEVGTDDLARLAAMPAPGVLLLQLETPLDANIAAAKAAFGRQTKVILDPAPAPHGGLPDELLRHVTIITPNEVECHALTGIRPETRADAARAAAEMTKRGVQSVVIKMGAHGAFWRGPGGQGQGEGHVQAFRVAAIDTVAAGDCFNGGLAVALDQGKTLGEAVRFASACGALATTKRGAAAAAPALAEVELLLAQNQL